MPLGWIQGHTVQLAALLTLMRVCGCHRKPLAADPDPQLGRLRLAPLVVQALQLGRRVEVGVGGRLIVSGKGALAPQQALSSMVAVRQARQARQQTALRALRLTWAAVRTWDGSTSEPLQRKAAVSFTLNCTNAA